jgi:hypothetical protein
VEFLIEEARRTVAGLDCEEFRFFLETPIECVWAPGVEAVPRREVNGLRCLAPDGEVPPLLLGIQLDNLP